MPHLLPPIYRRLSVARIHRRVSPGESLAWEMVCMVRPRTTARGFRRFAVCDWSHGILSGRDRSVALDHGF